MSFLLDYRYNAVVVGRYSLVKYSITVLRLKYSILNISNLLLTILVTVRFVVKTFLQNLLYLYYQKFPVFFLDHKIMTKLTN